MDGPRFDGWTRALATRKSRRQAVQAAAGGAIAGLLAHLGSQEAAAACVKPGRKACAGPKHRKCCAGARCIGGTKTRTGRCICRGNLTQCGSACVNTKTDKNNCGRCHKRCEGSLSCKNGKCTSKLGCAVGRNVCREGVYTNCPGSPNSSCHCITDVEGTPYCSNFSGVGCTSCTINADCGPGRVCVDTTGAICFCNSKICMPATCDGES